MTSSTRKFLIASALLAVSSPALFAQAATIPPNVPPSAGNAEPPTALLEPAVAIIREALAGIRPEKWKTPGPITQETTQNVGSIQRDLDSTLPALLTAADRNPASVQDVLPAYRNVDALYDVLLRITEVSKLAAPAQQSTPLQQAVVALEDARRTLGDQVQAAALNQTRAIVSLQTQLRTVQSSAAPVNVAAAPVCPSAPAATAKKKAAVKPKPKPAANATSTAAPPH